uniref:Peptidase_M1 domain-containing protein n=1 Tax=Parastrongyloides trichosuri TaxID=131310 RepID=A0A0N4ZEH3_PARTI
TTSTSRIVAHEVAHQLFGNIISMDWWNQLWLKEGFASYFQYEAISVLYPELDSLVDQLEGIFGAFNYYLTNRMHSMDIPDDDKKSLLKIYGAVSYRKGGAILRMVRGII